MYTVKWDGFSKQCKIMGQLFTGTLGSNPNMNQAIAGPKGALYTRTVSFTQLCSKYRQLFSKDLVTHSMMRKIV